jgi:hypothetical protein
MHPQAFPLLASDEDTKFHNKCKAMQELKAEALDVKGDNIDIQLEELAVSKLSLIDTFPSAQERIRCYSEVHNIVGNKITL